MNFLYSKMILKYLLFITAILLYFATLSTYAASTVVNTNEKPNIIVILTDDLGYGDIGVYGAKRIKTPNIDSLAENGIRFTNGYASANVCSPSRAGLLTGRYAIRSGLAWKVVEGKSTHGLPESEETIGGLAKKAGYNTMYIGKWHLGKLPQYSPTDRGFDNFFGVPHSNDMPNFELFENNRVIEKEINQTTLTRRYTNTAVDFIKQQQKQPFLLFLSHTFPHIPLHASEDFYGSSAAGLYGDTVQELDWSTGEIINTLRKTGALENTLIVFTSDNGPFFEGSSGGLKGGKGTSWEGGYKVPLIAQWPKVIAPEQVSVTLTSNIDIFPTLAELLMVKPDANKIDGKSLLPVFEDAKKSIHKYLYYFNNENIIAVRSNEWKYVTHSYYTGSLGAFEKFSQLPGFSAPYDLLFDAQGTDGESYSYADRKPKELNLMKQALLEARAEFYPLRTRPSEKTFPK